MATAMASPSSVPISVMDSLRAIKTRARSEQKQKRAVGNFSHLAQVVRKDMEFLKGGITRGIEWANDALHIPQISRTLDDLLWLRNLEDPLAPPLTATSWPQPSYPALTGVDLLMADLKALEAYAGYLYYMSKIWSKPLPEAYDPQDVADYFSCRPHVVALRLLQVFSSFAAALIRIRTSGIRKFVPSLEKDMDSKTSQYTFGMVLKETLLNLGPTFIKVGQSLSTRPDIIGTEISKALSELHDQIPPFPRTVAMRIIEEELGSSVQSYFSSISEEPIAAASFGQVYRGFTTDGIDVAVKVQRPNLRHVVVRDIYILRLGLGLLQKIANRKSDLCLYADELGKGLVGELDYTLEAANASKFMEVHSSFAFMRVPKVFPHLSRKRVLTMEWIVGDNPTDLLSLSTGESIDSNSTHMEEQKIDAKRRLLDLVNKGVEAALVQLLETGLLHADPHPGNLRYTSSGQIGFLDFGLLCQMEKKHQFAMLASIVHIVNGDWESLIRALTEMDVVRPGTNIRRVTLDLDYALGEVEFKDGIPDVKFSRVLGKIWSVALKYQFRMPPYYTLVLRSLASLEGLAVAADKNFKTFESAYPFVVRKLLTENSAATRKILYSVLLNRKKEFQWQRLSLFLRIGATRKGLPRRIASNNEIPVDALTNKATGVFDVASLVLRLLPSKDGAVLRRLLMTADGASLVRAVVSKEAKVFHQQFCGIIGDMLYQWIIQVFGQGFAASQHSQVILGSGPDRVSGQTSELSTSAYNYTSILKDRRIRLILSKILKSARKDPVLMLRFCWTSAVIIITASILACHRVIVSLSEAYFVPVHHPPKSYAMSA
ncbi:Protein kinase superfamily protein [Quillaja saponaria]|uniref:Protein kinase superfamily protein n=1 Tax=Quillaja saponaria TaxID=32244 RepID=A0AAD7Q5C0_QUISA|nr:Protein kinase superfamily protein [Quillaja saponaria]